MMIRRPGSMLLVFGLLFSVLTPAVLTAETVSVAPLDIQNMNGTADLDYLQGMIQGLLLYDLSTLDTIRLVDRRNLDRVLAEQSLQLSGITDEKSTMREVGRLTGARYLLRGTYVFLGTDLLVSLSLIDTETGEQRTFSQRGHTENLVHGLAEELVLALTGERVVFQNSNSQRSILSLQDETPGQINFFSPMIDGEIFLNDEFIGYTTGDGRKPFVMEDLSPGSHTLRVWMGREFGRVNMPGFTFEPWSTEIVVEPGKTKVVRDGTRGFNEIIYQAQQVVRESKRLESGFTGTETLEKEFAYLDRKGNPVEGSFTVLVTVEDSRMILNARVRVNGEVLETELTVPRDGKEEFTRMIGDLECSVEGTWNSYGTLEVDYELWRKDIEQNMFR